MARCRAKGKGKTKKAKDQQTKLSRWLGRSPSPESTPPPEVEERNARRNLRWLHAGVYEDVQCQAFDIWYAFKKRKDGGYKIIYARNGQGTSLGNFDVGQIKRNLITFDEHHLRKWRHFLSRRGTWLYGNAMRGRYCQRKTLLETFLNPNFVDPFPEGLRKKAIGPSLNAIHNANDKIGPGPARPSSSRGIASSPLTPGECYPNTNIPLSTKDIKIGAFKKINQDAMQVIGNFLTGRLSYYAPNSNHRTGQVERIESAFYEHGWRVDRVAVEQALEEMQEPGSTAFDSAAFNQDMPIRVDMYKGEDVEKLMEKVGGKANNEGSNSEDESEDDSDDDSDDDSNDLFVRQNMKRPRAKPAFRKENVPNFEANLARIMAGHRAQAARNSDSDDYDYLPDDSPLKGKGPAPRKHSRGQGNLTESQDADYIEIDEERSAPAKRIKSEAPVFRNSQDNPIVIEENSDDSDIEIDEARSCPRGGLKREAPDDIIVLDTGNE